MPTQNRSENRNKAPERLVFYPNCEQIHYFLALMIPQRTSKIHSTLTLHKSVLL